MIGRLLIAFFALTTSVLAETPRAPEFGVYDEATRLALPVLKAHERVLSEHRNLTNESVFIAVLKSTPPEGLAEKAREILDAWRMQTPKPPNTVLMLVDSEKGELEIRVGLGLDAIVTDGRIQEIRKNYFRPEWREGNDTRAITLSVVEVLRTLESPLISGGEAIESYERAGFTGGWVPVSVKKQGNSWWIWMLIGFTFVVFVLIRALAVEAHYTALGWVRVPAWKSILRTGLRRRKNKSRGEGLITGGGVSGSY